MNHTTFVVTRFQNQSGTVSWRVSGNLHGARIRKNFSSKEEARAEKAALELKALQSASGLRASATFLSEDQLREAEGALRRLADRPQTLTVYLDYALANFHEAERKVLLDSAVPEYVAARKADVERTLLSLRQFRAISNELVHFKSYFPGDLVAQFTAPQLISYFNRGGAGLKTYNNRRGILSTFFRFAAQNDWVERNPVEKTPSHRISHRRGSAETLSAEQSEKLMVYVEGFNGGTLVPYFALCLFAGVRPCPVFGEISVSVLPGAPGRVVDGDQ